MIEAKAINPAGSSRNRSNGTEPSDRKPGLIHRLRRLMHLAPAALSGDSSSVMDNYMKFRREHRGV